jgi:lipoate-protein ligase A
MPVKAPAFRTWIYQRPAIVLGCAQRSLRTTIEKRTAGTIDIIDRDSGGGAVLAGPWLVSVSVALPHRHPLLGKNLGDSYRGLAQLHLSAIKNFGVAARAWFPSELIMVSALGDPALDWACFGRLSPWEVISTGGQKLVGLAQKRNQNGVLLVGGTLIKCVNWKLLCDAMACRDHLNALTRRTISVEEILGAAIDATEFSNELTQRLASWTGSDEKALRP